MKLRTFIKKFSTDEACRAHLESVRWPEGPVCPRCGTVAEATAVVNKPGYWQCRPCGKQFSVTAGTPMHGTHLPLSVWYLAMYLILASSKGISAVKLGEQLGVQYRTAWHLGHRIRAMLASGEKPILSGLVEADETYVGGKAKNLPKGAAKPEKRGRGTIKPMVLAALQRGGEARTLVVPSASGAAIAPALWGWTGKGGATLLTDELAAYDWIGRKMEAHHAVIHSRGEYARTVGGCGSTPTRPKASSGCSSAPSSGCGTKSAPSTCTATPPSTSSAGTAARPRCRSASRGACWAPPGGCGSRTCWRDGGSASAPERLPRLHHHVHHGLLGLLAGLAGGRCPAVHVLHVQADRPLDRAFCLRHVNFGAGLGRSSAHFHASCPFLILQASWIAHRGQGHLRSLPSD